MKSIAGYLSGIGPATVWQVRNDTAAETGAIVLQNSGNSFT
ncbi:MULTISPECIES: hypothetical protein [Comamonas]|nr:MULTISPECIES: hypothetical protein [Comamonas]KWT74758.1 hypothetical protein APV28_0122 [Comamonas testosteroni]